MTPGGSHRFTVGAFRCMTLTDGHVDYPPGNFFANVPQDEVNAALSGRGLTTDYVRTPYSFLYLETGTHRVLVDMGAGSLAPSTGKLLDNMRVADIEPADIDVVVITHAHPDHVGGALNGEGKPVYSNARYIMWRREWDFWFSDEAGDMAPESHVAIARRNVEPLQDRIEFLDDESEFLPGFKAVQAPGHTPGHMAVLVSSEDDHVFYISDTVLYPLHLEHPDWLPVYDILPDEAAQSKRKVFDLAAEQNLLVMGMHFPPFPSLGRVGKTETGWEWRPIQLDR
jgi:glyoxylase-like metal-dependent hydrolase (beta-lactamase superfamily II)